MYDVAIYAKLSVIVPMNEYALHLTDEQKERVIDVVDEHDREWRRQPGDTGWYCLHVDEDGFTFEGDDKRHGWRDE